MSGTLVPQAGCAKLHSAVDLNLLLALDALLEQRSVTEAARRQAVTPSAMSHPLRQIGALLDDPLLVRTRGGMPGVRG